MARYKITLYMLHIMFVLYFTRVFTALETIFLYKRKELKLKVPDPSCRFHIVQVLLKFDVGIDIWPPLAKRQPFFT